MENATAILKGSKWLRIFGLLAAVGLVLAIGRIVLRVFREDSAEDEESHEAA